MHVIRVWQVDSDELLREAVELTLCRARGVRLERAFATVEELVSGASGSPDVVVIDPWTQPDGSARACALVADTLPDAGILVHTARTGPRDVGRVLLSGARGFVPKRTGRFALLRAIRRTHTAQGCVVVGLDGGSDGPDRDRAARELAALSPRELEVVQCVAGGFTSREAAALLGCSNRTIETHRRNIMGRLQVKSRAGLVRLAVLAGIGPPEGV